MKIKKFLSIVLITCMLFNTGCAGCGKNTNNEPQTVVETVTNSDGEVIGTEIHTIDKEAASQANKNAEWEAKVVEAGGIIPEYAKGKLVAPLQHESYILSDINEWKLIDPNEGHKERYFFKELIMEDGTHYYADLVGGEDSQMGKAYAYVKDRAEKYAYAMFGIDIGTEIYDWCYCKTSEAPDEFTENEKTELVYMQVSGVTIDNSTGKAWANIFAVTNSNMEASESYAVKSEKIDRLTPYWIVVNMIMENGEPFIIDKTTIVAGSDGFVSWNDVSYQRIQINKNATFTIVPRSTAKDN